MICHAHVRKDTRLSPRIHIHIPEPGNLGIRLSSMIKTYSRVTFNFYPGLPEYDLLTQTTQGQVVKERAPMETKIHLTAVTNTKVHPPD